MITIYKYEIPMEDKFSLNLPKGAKLLTCQLQFLTPVLWAWVDTKEPLEKRNFLLIGTGQEFPEKFRCFYIGTFQVGEFVGHLFEELTKE